MLELSYLFQTLQYYSFCNLVLLENEATILSLPESQYIPLFYTLIFQLFDDKINKSFGSEIAFLIFYVQPRFDVCLSV